jgi:hypothetical protein
VTELYNRLVNLDVAPGFAAIAAVQAGQTAPYSGLVGNALIKPDRNNFSPRLGLAWRPPTKGSLVILAGYGIYYNTSVYNSLAANLAQQPPFRPGAECHQLRGEPADHRERFSAGDQLGDEQQLCHRSELPHRLRADLELLPAARSAVRPVRNRGLSGYEGHAARSAVHS